MKRVFLVDEVRVWYCNTCSKVHTTRIDAACCCNEPEADVGFCKSGCREVYPKLTDLIENNLEGFDSMEIKRLEE